MLPAMKCSSPQYPHNNNQQSTGCLEWAHIGCWPLLASIGNAKSKWQKQLNYTNLVKGYSTPITPTHLCSVYGTTCPTPHAMHLLTIPRDWGKEVAGPAFTSPLRHSVPNWYGFMPRRSIAGAGPETATHTQNESTYVASVEHLWWELLYCSVQWF